jgi:hypothetical protein
MWRAALLATQLLSPKTGKVTDGVCRLLAKSDVDRLKAKGSATLLQEGEELMQQAWAEVAKAEADGLITADQSTTVFGKLAVRLVLHAVGKSSSFEQKKYNDHKQIHDLFLKELGACHKICMSQSPRRPTGASSQSSGSIESMLSLDEASDPLFLLTKEGYQVGSICTLKGKKRKYRLETLSSTNADLKEIVIAAEGEVVSLDLAEFKSTAKLHSKQGGYPVAVDVDSAAPFYPSMKETLKQERSRCSLFVSLASEATDNDHYTFLFSLCPNEVRSTAPHRKGELKLFPATDCISKISFVPILKVAHASHGSVIIKFQQFRFKVTPPKFPTTEDCEGWKDISLVPFWWVAEADADDANMVLKYSSEGIPYLTNSKALKSYDQLVVGFSHGMMLTECAKPKEGAKLKRAKAQDA